MNRHLHEPEPGYRAHAGHEEAGQELISPATAEGYRCPCCKILVVFNALALECRCIDECYRGEPDVRR